MGGLGRFLAAALVVVVVLAGGPVASAAASGSAAAPAPTADAALLTTTGGVDSAERLRGGTLAQTTQQSADVVLTQEFRLTPERPGEVAVTHNYTLADRMASLRTTVPRRGTVTETRGFGADNETVYAWDGETAAPSITYRLPVNETGSQGVAAENGSLLFADVGEWALFRRPAVSTTWQAFGTDPVTYDRQTATVGPGAAGNSLVYLGDVRVHPRTVDGQTLRLAVPGAANLSTRPADVLDALERASRDLDVGDRDETVFAVAAPTEGVPWAVRGITVGDGDVWVGADERLADPDNIWVHEYVHTRMDYETTAATRWTTEGFATYYAARQALQHESLRFDSFADALATGANPGGNVTLAEPETWGNLTAYDRGGAVAAEIDRRVRLASDGDRSLDAVLATMNEDTDTVTESEFYAAVAEAGDADVREAVRSAVDTNRSIARWNRSTYVDAFGSLPARFHTGLPRAGDRGGYSVSGPYRNATLSGEAPYTVVPGERLTVGARVENTGGTSGFYDVELDANGRVVDAVTGELAANETRRVPLSVSFDRLGEYTVGVGNETLPVRVRRPATADLAGFRLSQGAVQQYDSVSVLVTVRNDAAIPGERAVSVARNGSTVVTETVRVGPRSNATVPIELRFPTAGRVNVTVAGMGSVGVEVERSAQPQPENTPGRTPPSTPTEGAGAAAAVLGSLLAIAVAVGVLRYVRR